MMNPWRCHQSLAAVLAMVGSLTLVCQGASAQIGSSSTYTAAELKQHFQDQAEGYQMTAGGKRLEFQSQPLMHWNNPVRKQEQGALYVWTRQGRPFAFVSIFSYEHDNEMFRRHELISFSDEPIAARLDGAAAWSPSKPGLTWTPLRDVAKPASSPARRLSQMRGIARQFTGQLRARGHQPARLQLMPQPVFRYQGDGGKVVDGAAFALSVATDPEIWLLVEATRLDGALIWQYAAARAHYGELELRRNDQVVWSKPAVEALMMTRQGQQPYANDPYFLFHPNTPIPEPEMLR